LTYKLSPGLALRLWNTRFDILDLAGAKASYSPLVLGAGKRGANGTLEIGKRGTRRGLALAGIGVCSHGGNVNGSEARLARKVML